MFLRKTIEKQKNKVKTGKSRLLIVNIFAFLEKLGDKVTHYFNLEATTIHNVLVDVVIFMLFQLLCDIIVDVFQIIPLRSKIEKTLNTKYSHPQK